MHPEIRFRLLLILAVVLWESLVVSMVTNSIDLIIIFDLILVPFMILSIAGMFKLSRLEEQVNELKAIVSRKWKQRKY